MDVFPWLLATLLATRIFYLVFESTLLAKYIRNAHRWRHSNQVARKRLARRHSRNYEGTPAISIIFMFCFTIVVLK